MNIPSTGAVQNPFQREDLTALQDDLDLATKELRVATQALKGQTTQANDEAAERDLREAITKHA